MNKASKKWTLKNLYTKTAFLDALPLLRLLRLRRSVLFFRLCILSTNPNQRENILVSQMPGRLFDFIYLH